MGFNKDGSFTLDGEGAYTGEFDNYYEDMKKKKEEEKKKRKKKK